MYNAMVDVSPVNSFPWTTGNIRAWFFVYVITIGFVSVIPLSVAMGATIVDQ